MYISPVFSCWVTYIYACMISYLFKDIVEFPLLIFHLLIFHHMTKTDTSFKCAHDTSFQSNNSVPAFILIHLYLDLLVF